MSYVPPKVTFKRATHYTEGRTEPIRALVNHRMVGTLAGTDSMFTKPDAEAVSTHFGIGIRDGKVVITQYVPLDDTAWGNGVMNAGSNWEKWGFKTTQINAQTINIEHQDMDGTDANKGKVSPAIQAASQWLQALLLRANEAEWRKYGLTMRNWSNMPILKTELRAIPKDGRHIITHHDITPVGKPYCWMPWAKDTVGYPRTTYVTNINKMYGYTDAIVPDPVVPVPPTTPVLYTQAQLDAAVAAQKQADAAAVAAANAAAAKSAAVAKAAPAIERERIAVAMGAAVADIVRNI